LKSLITLIVLATFLPSTIHADVKRPMGEFMFCTNTESTDNKGFINFFISKRNQCAPRFKWANFTFKRVKQIESDCSYNVATIKLSGGKHQSGRMNCNTRMTAKEVLEVVRADENLLTNKRLHEALRSYGIKFTDEDKALIQAIQQKKKDKLKVVQAPKVEDSKDAGGLAESKQE